MVNGRWVVWDSKHQTLDEKALTAALYAELVKQDKIELLQRRKVSQTLATYLRDFYAQWD